MDCLAASCSDAPSGVLPSLRELVPALLQTEIKIREKKVLAASTMCVFQALIG